MAIPVPLAFPAPFIGAGANPGGDFLSRQVFEEPLNKLLNPRGELGPNNFVEIFNEPQVHYLLVEAAWLS